LTALFSRLGFGAFIRSKEQWVFIGTGDGDARGIYVSLLNTDSGKLSGAKLAGEARRPGFLAIHPNGEYLFAITSSIPGHDAEETGGVSAFRIKHETGQLSLINQQPSGGRGPCHLSLDHEGRVVLVANYHGGSCEAIGVNEDGSLKEPGSFMQHEGSSVDEERQKGPHAHSANPGPNDRFAFVADLGLDKILIYKLDPVTATLTPNGAGIVPPGSGPRHFAFHPNGRWAYANGEMLMNVTGFNFDVDQGTLSAFQTVSTVPEDTDLTGLSTAEILVHQSGKFLYVSNRGQDTITVFSIDSDSGKLTFVEREPVQVKEPRSFGMDITGKFLLASGQESHSVAVFRIDQGTGKLDFTGQTISVPSPRCVKFLTAG